MATRTALADEIRAFGQTPIENRALNFIEQIDQTWTFVVALEATRKLLEFHQNQEFQLAPGAHAALEFDIMSKKATSAPRHLRR